MKGKLWKIGTLLFAVLMLISACAGSIQDSPSEENDAAPTQDERLTQLESALVDLQQKEQEYISQIAALQAQLERSNTASSTEPLAERVTFHYRAENGGAVITGYSGSVALLTVPSTLDGLPVVAIGERAFEKATFTAVKLPDSIVSIGWFAFYECNNLADVTIPAGVTSIGHAVFDGCPLITLRCPAGSFAEKYAQSYAIPHTSF